MKKIIGLTVEEKSYFLKCLIRVFKDNGFLDDFKKECHNRDDFIRIIDKKEKRGYKMSLHDMCLDILWQKIKLYTKIAMKNNGAINEMSEEYTSALASIQVIKLIDLMGMMRTERMIDISKEAKSRELSYIAHCFSCAAKFTEVIANNVEYCIILKKCLEEDNKYIDINTRVTIVKLLDRRFKTLQ